MTRKVNELAARKAETDCMAWKPLDALNRYANDIENGSIDPEAIIIIGMEKRDGKLYFPHQLAGLDAISLPGVLTRFLITDLVSDMCEEY